MAVPNEWAVKHQLQRVTITVDYSDSTEATVHVTGSTPTKRGNLWAYSEVVDGSRRTLSVPDVVHHIITAVHQDRPARQDALSKALAGGCTWEEPPLPF